MATLRTRAAGFKLTHEGLPAIVNKACVDFCIDGR